MHENGAHSSAVVLYPLPKHSPWKPELPKSPATCGSFSWRAPCFANALLFANNTYPF